MGFETYLEKNKDFAAFLDQVSDNTGRRNIETWKKNLRENLDLFKKTGWAASILQGKEKGKTAIIIGASPSIERQVETLREIQHDSDFVLCGLSSNLEFLLKNGIQPKYLTTVDADPSQGEFFDNVDMDKTKDITLITNTFSYPEMLKLWKGQLYFLALDSADKWIEKKQKKWYGNINGNGRGFPTLMGQFNTMTVLAFLVLECKTLLFVGNEMSFRDKEIRYYVDRDDPRDKEPRLPHGDIYGNIVWTTYGLLALKLCLEHFLEVIAGAGWFFNCSEAGIFGITKRVSGHHVPWIKQLTLKNGIAQARHIMRTGEPFYEFTPNLIEKKGDQYERFCRTLSVV
jgi:hypothetical protein